MRIAFIRLIICAVLGASLAATSLQAAAGSFDDWLAGYRKAADEGKTTHVVEIDNDTLLMNKNDGFYTSGLRYAQTHTLEDAGSVTSFGWRFGQELYTASDIKLPPSQVKAPDHPYAGWLYFGTFKDHAAADGSRSRVGIDLGCLGPCAGGKWLQTNFHKVIDQPEPQGWSRQVKNEFGVVLYGDYAPLRWAPQFAQSWLDITPAVNGRFGNIFTDVGASVTLRAGRLNLLPHQSTLHAYTRFDAHAVGYNATLQGGYFSKDNPHTVAPKRFVGEAQVGVVWQDGPYAATLAVARRSNEIRDLPNSVGAQSYVHMLFSYTP